MKIVSPLALIYFGLTLGCEAFTTPVASAGLRNSRAPMAGLVNNDVRSRQTLYMTGSDQGEMVR